jgi:hypothetical protein
MNEIFMTTLTFISFQMMDFQVMAEEKIVFNSSDGLKITADLNVNNPKNSPFIISSN